MTPEKTAELLAQGRKIIHFLHIGKAAGSQVGLIARGFNAQSKDFAIHKHPHGMVLRDLPRQTPYMFSVRHPVSRFLSGFHSRKRKGQPKLLVPWTRHETLAFADFEHANDLAEALFSQDDRGLLAFRAIKSIGHTAQNQVDWIAPMGYFLKRRPPIAILRQEQFDSDLAAVSAYVGEDIRKYITTDPKNAHRNDYSAVPPLTELAVSNLERWYAQDIEFYRLCSSWMDRKLKAVAKAQAKSSLDAALPPQT